MAAATCNEAISLAGLFVGQGPGGAGARLRPAHPDIFETAARRRCGKAPLVVLVDRLSASASEILAAVIQDYGRGVVVGQRTFGKGTVQNIYRIPRRQRGDAGPPYAHHGQVLPA